MSQTINQVDQARGRAVVMQPEDGPSYWQPVPANGHADPKLYPAITGFPVAACASTRMVIRSSYRSASAARAARWWTAKAIRSCPELRAFLATTSSTSSSTRAPRTTWSCCGSLRRPVSKTSSRPSAGPARRAMPHPRLSSDQPTSSPSSGAWA